MSGAPTEEGPQAAPRGPSPVEPLASYVARAEAATGAELLQVIEEALLHPEIFVYGELLALPNVAELGRKGGPVEKDGGLLEKEGGPPSPPQTPEARAFLLLRLLASGTVGDLVAAVRRQETQPVPVGLLHKLRLLTISSLAALCPKLLFADIQQALEAPGCCSESWGPPQGCQTLEDEALEGPLPGGPSSSASAAAAGGKARLSVEETEALVIECLQLGLVSGRIDGAQGCLDSWGALPRDPTERDLQAMLSVLGGLELRLQRSIALLSAKQGPPAFGGRGAAPGAPLPPPPFSLSC
ncbi:hypothetical protein Esti_000855 [Eimeria stiedai]